MRNVNAGSISSSGLDSAFLAVPKRSLATRKSKRPRAGALQQLPHVPRGLAIRESFWNAPARGRFPVPLGGGAANEIKTFAGVKCLDR